jgi:UDP-glucuronate decarboxylase
MTQALRSEDMTIYGNGSQTRSFCYVDDLVDGLMRLADHAAVLPRPINLGNPLEMTVTSLAEKIIALTGSSSRIVYRPLPVDDPKRRKPDISAAKRHLGWSPKVVLTQGLARTIEWLADDPAVVGGRPRKSMRASKQAAAPAVSA